uniref:Rifampin ADP-ribosylating transferase n=1 Tax=Klebsiella pneumoniae TaxID=573 RepID=K4PF87_KLEPN|nr:rifampin ADP-ribosylating transferase [Klebsiella pneumoniae]
MLSNGDLPTEDFHLISSCPCWAYTIQSSRCRFAARLISGVRCTKHIAMSLSGLEGRGYIYIVEPTGPFEDDPNLTNKRFPGNPTQSYRTCEPLRIVGVVEDWEGHPVELIRGMLDSLEDLKRRGLHVIED